MAAGCRTGPRRHSGTTGRRLEPTGSLFGRTALLVAADFHLPKGWAWVRSSGPRGVPAGGVCVVPRNGHLFTRKCRNLTRKKSFFVSGNLRHSPSF